MCKRAVLSFGDVGEYACGPWGRRSVDIAIFGAQLGFCCAYFGFVGENLHSVIYSYFDCYNIDQKLIMVAMSMWCRCGSARACCWLVYDGLLRQVHG